MATKKNVNIQSKKPFFKKQSLEVITSNNRTLIKSSYGVVGVLLSVPLIASAVWLINLLAAYFSPVPEGVMAAPISTNKIFALIAFMVGYSIFLMLMYFSKRKK